LDLVERNAVQLGDVQQLVLDEADRLLDEGFADELSRIRALLPAQRQNLLFSATFSPDVQALAGQFLNDPLRVEVQAQGDQAAPDISQRAIEVDAHRRGPLLRHLIQTEHWPRVLVFVATRHSAEVLAMKMNRAGIATAVLHGELSQGARREALGDLQRGAARVLVATDLAARGLHLPDLPVVVNHDLPRSADDYIHRIGRTARAGASGLAVSFIAPEAESHFRLIEKRQGLRVARERVPGFEPKDQPTLVTGAAGEAAKAGSASTLVAPDGGGIKGKRKSKKDKAREAAAGKR
jgi:superfamily II DNA/RNA helicase